MKKRILAMFLCLCMLLSMLPLSALADDSTTGTGYSDIKSTAWYYPSVQYVTENSLMNGVGNNRFAPGETLTRGMLVTILYRADGSPSVSGSCPFTDVKESRYYYNAVLWAVENEITKGVSTTSFAPEVEITREQMTVFLYRYAAYKGYDVSATADLSGYTDAGSISNYAKTAMAWANATGLIKGRTSTTLAPKGLATRAEAATLIHRYFINIVAGTERSEYTVTFMLNDGSEGAYLVNTVHNGDTVSRPDAPNSEFYSFTGWYTDPYGAEAYDFSTQVKSDLYIYAGWDAPDGGDGLYGYSSGGGTDASITGAEVTEDEVIVTINTEVVAALVVEFLDEETEEPVVTVATETLSYCELVPVSIAIDAEALPETYLLRASLQDEDGNYLCDPYTTVRYTAAGLEYAAKTVNDFEGETVLNYDDSIDNNFGVVAEGVKKIISSDDSNHLTSEYSTEEDEDGIVVELNLEGYRISEPDEQALALVEGDVILMTDTDGTLQLFKIGTLTVEDDGSLFITPAEGAGITDYYSFLKVDMEFGGDEDAELSEEPSTMALLMQEEDWDNEAYLCLDVIDVDCDRINFTGGLDFTYDPAKYPGWEAELQGTWSIAVSFSVLYDAHLFKKDYVETSTKVVKTIHAEFHVEASNNHLENDDETKKNLVKEITIIPKNKVPTPVTGLFFEYKISCPLEITFTGKFTIQYESKDTSGFTYNSNSGRQKIDKKESSVDVDLTGEMEIKFGIKVTAGLTLLGDVVEVKVEPEAGVKFNAVADLGGTAYTNADSKHACALCISATLKLYFGATAKLELHIVKDVLDWEIFNLKLINHEWKLGEGYWSLINSSDSIFKGSKHAGWGECPNKAYRVTVQALDSQGGSLSVPITVKKNNGSTNETKTTEFSIYLYNGTYKASGNIENTAVSKTFTVSSAAKTVTLTKTSADGKIEGKVVDATSKDPIDGATVIISDGSVDVATCTTDSNGSYTCRLPAGNYTIKVTKDGYVSGSFRQSVDEGLTVYPETALMVSILDSNNRGGFAGRITDATTNNGVSGVALDVRAGWNAAADDDILYSLTTDSNGYYKKSYTKLFGVGFGVPAGNYTITATKDGYATASFNITVEPDSDNPDQNFAISPVTSDDVYRIILSWGSSPSDLDSHLVGALSSGGTEHVYYSSKTGYASNLDVDDTSSYGPETITVTDFADFTNGFTYYVHDYTNRSSSSSTALAGSDAKVEVYKGSTLVKTFYVPTSGSGTVWNVFSIDASGKITANNTFSYQSSASSVGVTAAIASLFTDDEKAA